MTGNEDLVQTPSEQAETLSGHQDYEAKAREIASIDICDNPELIASIASALSSAVTAEREACARLVHKVQLDKDSLTVKSADPFSAGDVWEAYYTGANAAMAAVYMAIRNRGTQMTAPLPSR